MAMLLVEGFDSLALLSEKYSIVAGTPTISSSVKNTGTQASSATNGEYFGFDLPDTETTIFLGFAFRITSLTSPTSSQTCFLRFRYYQSDMCAVGVNADGKFEVMRSTSVVGTSENSIVVDTWYYVEVKATIKNPSTFEAGDFIIKVDEVEWLNLPAASDTSTSGVLFDEVVFGGNGSAGIVSLDDMYILNEDIELRDSRISFLGESRVRTLYPINMYLSQWHGSDGNDVDNNLLVDEDIHSGDTDYIYSDYGDSAAVDVFRHDAMIFCDQVHAICLRAVARNENSDTDTELGHFRVVGAPTWVSMGIPTTTYAVYDDVMAESASGGGGDWNYSFIGSYGFGIIRVDQ